MVVLDGDTQFPVRADHIIGWGYELVDASAEWDIVLNRDVLGLVAHEIWSDSLYRQHPHGIRITFLDCQGGMVVGVGELPCLGTEAPIPLFLDRKQLGFSYGDGVGSEISAACARPNTNYYDPQQCFIGLGPVDAGHMTDVVVGATITAQEMIYQGYGNETPDFRQAPITLNPLS